jgi:hypothetical protein
MLQVIGLLQGKVQGDSGVKVLHHTSAPPMCFALFHIYAAGDEPAAGQGAGQLFALIAVLANRD